MGWAFPPLSDACVPMGRWCGVGFPPPVRRLCFYGKMVWCGLFPPCQTPVFLWEDGVVWDFSPLSDACVSMGRWCGESAQIRSVWFKSAHMSIVWFESNYRVPSSLPCLVFSLNGEGTPDNYEAALWTPTVA